MANRGDSRASLFSLGSECCFDLTCDLCSNESKFLEAVGYCTNCRDYLCEECYKTHLKPRPLSHHNLLNQDMMPRDTSQAQLKDTCTEPCHLHPDETLKFYCTTHDELGCSVCLNLRHKCEGMEYIPELAKDVLKSTEYKVLNMKVKELTKTVKHDIETIKQKSQSSNQQHDNAIEFFKQLRKELIAAADKLDVLIMGNIGKITDENQIMIKAVEKQLNQILTDLGAMDSKFITLENKGQLCQLYISMKKSQNEIASFETCLIELQDQRIITKFEVKKSHELQNMMQQPEKMAALEIERNPQMESLLNTLSKPKQHNAIVRESNAYKKKVLVDDIAVNMEEQDQYPHITGTLIMPGERLVMVDNANFMVILIDLQSKKIISYLNYDNNLAVFGITKVTDTQVAITCSGEKTLLFINVTNTLTLYHTIKLKGHGEFRGIASLVDNFVITSVNPVKVEIISQKGKLLQTVVGLELGWELFINPLYVTVSPDQQTIYISDSDKNNVTSLDLNGQVKASYEDSELECPSGLFVDRSGVLYVCGKNSHSVQRLTPDLHKKQILLQESDGILYPKSLSLDKAQNKLYIGMEDSDILKVYQID